LRLYVDGESVGSMSLHADLPDVGAELLNIGSDGGRSSLDGAIDDLRIYDRPLSSEEIQRIYWTCAPVGISLLEARFAALEARLAGVRWQFNDNRLEWWHAQLTALDVGLNWLATMREVALSSTETEYAKARWSEAIEGIARSPKYEGQRWPSGDRLTPQAGLLPLGENPVTGLWEFVHLQTGAEPTLGADGHVLRDAEGRLTLAPETGMVLVLLPGGRVPEESSDQGQQSWIPLVELGPFFISKYEITHEQWDRLSVRRGVAHRREVPLVAANQVSWDDANAMWLRELGWCGLPSEAQWEYACRAGTHSRWWIGDDVQALVGVANVVLVEMDENFIAPVGSLKPNPFGLHDVHGNVSEWCGDGYVAVMPARALDGLRDDGVDSTRFRVVRGGDWRLGPVHASSAGRYGESPGNRFDHGLRASRSITP
jgi:formylglycine-generating enzyme required for sulfatase activity